MYALDIDENIYQNACQNWSQGGRGGGKQTPLAYGLIVTFMISGLFI